MVRLNTEELASGVYSIRVSDGENVKVKKLVIQ